MFASMKGNFQIVKLLIENNADLNIQTKVLFKKNIIIYFF
jgi:ankyrin repeat protein